MSVDHTFEKYPGDAGERPAEGTAPSEPATRHPASPPGAGITAADTRPQPGAVPARLFRAGGDARSRLDAVAGAGRGAPQTAPDAIAVLEPFRGLLPDGLRRGEAVALASRDRSPDYLALALLAGALAAGLWCAAVGVAGLGGVALAELLGGADRRAALDRLLLVPEPGEQWAEVTAGLADGVDLLLVRPPGAVSAEVGRRVDARLRQGRASGTRHSAAMLVLGTWSSARLVLRTAQTVWTGLDGVGPSAGTGHLTGGRGTLVAEGRATAGRPRTLRLWLPGADGTARALIDVQAEGAPPGAVPSAVPDAAPPASAVDGPGTGWPPRPPLTAVA